MSEAVLPAGTQRRRSRIVSGVLHLVLLGASLAMLYPLLWMLASSFKPDNEIFASMALWPTSLDLSAYARGWSGLQISFGRFFWNSAVIALLAVIGNVLSCSLTAFAFARLRFRGKPVWFALMLGTLQRRLRDR